MPAVNPAAALGRINYFAHVALYPLLLGTFYFGYSSYSEKGRVKAEKDAKDAMPTGRKVDPDLFNPFSPVPFHNSAELKYRFAPIRMHNYLDPKTHLNLKDYAFKTYHDSYDHEGKKQHYYNWVSMVPSHHA